MTQHEIKAGRTRLLSVEGVADALHVRPKTVRRWRSLGLLKGVQIGKRVWFSEAAVEAFLKIREAEQAP